MKKFYFLVCLSLLIGVFLMEGCEEKVTEVEEAAVDTAAAIQKVEQADEALEDKLYSLISTEFEDVEEPSDVDFSSPNSLYEEALQLDPNNSDANFGAALTELLIISADQDVNDAFDRWEAFLDTASIFERGISQSPSSRLNRGLPVRVRDLDIPPNTVGRVVFGLFGLALSSPPQISEIQDLVENELLPRVDYALARLDVVDGFSDYQFTVTPKMQGDSYADSLEIDLTEIYGMEVVLNLLRFFTSVAISYDFNFATYDSAGLANTLARSSDFLTLRSDGTTHMASAKTAYLSATEKLEEGINFLKSETDPQDDDIIKIDPAGPAEADLDTVLAHLDEARQILTGDWNLTADFDDDPTTLETVTFRWGALFDDPIEDFKALLPPYTVSVERDYYGDLVVEFEWEADNFDDWIFPDPTFGGVLPGMTDSELKDIFGITEEDWSKEW